MTTALGTLPRNQKGPLGPPPALSAPLQQVADVVSAWPGIETTVHWHFSNKDQVDGVDFYWGEEELGHIHLDGSIHLATCPELGRNMIEEGVAEAFPYQRGWVEGNVMEMGVEAAVGLFWRNYERYAGGSAVRNGLR